MKNNSQKTKFLYALSLGLELGFLIVLPLIFFLFLGLFLDRQFKTAPLFLIFLIILSIIVTIFDVRYLILPFLEKKVGKGNKK